MDIDADPMMTTDLQVNMDESTNFVDEKKQELHQAILIIRQLYTVAPQCVQVIAHNLDYLEYIDKRDNRDLYEIEMNAEDGEYKSFADVITEIRCLLLNCYKYFGPRHKTTYAALNVEKLLDECIFCLDERLKSTTDVQQALDIFKTEKTYDYKYLYPKDHYDSKLLKSVAHCRPERLKIYHNAIEDKIALTEKSVMLLEELNRRKNEIDFDCHSQYVTSMWELAEIGNFVSALAGTFHIGDVYQGEIEGMFLIPKESTLMSKIMTLLLGPMSGKRCINNLMSYKVWTEKLSKKISSWFEVYHEKDQGKAKVFKEFGIHRDFWTVVGDKNPLIDKEYFELPYLVKVWLLKGLCDHVLFKYKSMKDIVVKCKEEKCTVWKSNDGTEEYFYFSIMPDLRLYYHKTSNDKKFDGGLKGEPFENRDLEDELPRLKGICKTFRSRSQFKPNEDNFKMIANTVQGVRTLIEESVAEGNPESLILSLEEYLRWVEKHEYNYLSTNNESKINLYRDWKLTHPANKHKVKNTKLDYSEEKEPIKRRQTEDHQDIDEYYENKKAKIISCPDTSLYSSLISEDEDEDDNCIKIVSVSSVAPRPLNTSPTVSSVDSKKSLCTIS
ncbi:uncharacterized protein LOC126842476 [Adelges cooleyi]|uniref:uncharacterized protein LOC126840084 n=1 Tax=Adelges cooleyi TaxID=133065 RepID=UPI00217F371B|nr:uncharacterized protein LOC126840084 [Adelges cooleyi]XP_050435444.1 uncharacterized protein LOC126842476 [Adelges cooleyi]